MSLKDQIRDDLKDAMRSKENLRRDVIRGLLAAIKDAEQSKYEDLTARALKKHNVSRPQQQDEESMAAFDAAVSAAVAAEKVEENAALTDPDVLGVVQKMVKQRQDSIDEAKGAGRDDIAESEQAELDILQDYLPKQMSREEIAAEAQQVIAETGASEMKDMGRVMGPLMEKLKGRADGKLISEVVREQLS
jgi:uncharacterized protein YqeY